MRTLLLPLLATVVWLSTPSALFAEEEVSQDASYSVVATTGMIADSVRQVAGEHIEVLGLMGPGVDPHLYRQTRSDISAMINADAVFWNGLYLEAQLESFLERLASRKPVVAVAETVPDEQRRADDDNPNQPDPHVWMSPRRWHYVVDAIEATLSELAPAHSETFAANASAFKEELTALDDYAREVLDNVPASSRVLVTAHDAFGYFGDAYDFEVLGIQGFSTESEAGLARIESLVALLVERDIGAIFVESSVPERNVRALVEGAAARGHTVHIGGELFSDAMGPPGSYEGTYIGMLDHNMTLIARALGGDAPAGGLRGKLSHDDSQHDSEDDA